MENIGFVGIGTMGSRMLKNVLKAGYPVYTYDILPSAQEYAASVGATPLNSSKEVAECCNIVITMVPTFREVEDVVFNEKGLLKGFRKGSMLIDMTSSLPESTRKTEARLREQGIAMIDAPVSGGSLGAEKGTLSIMIGGEDENIERAMPILQTMGTNLTKVGTIGMGHTAKAINNMLFGTTLVAACEALTLGAKEGIDIGTLIEIMQHSSGQCYSVNKIKNFALQDNFKPGFSLDLLVKDVRTAFAIGESLNVPMPVSHAAKEFLMIGQNRGWGKDDNTKMILLSEEQSGTHVSL